MIGFGFSEGKNIPSPEHSQIVALYDPHSGIIKHIHIITTLSGGKPLAPDEAIAEAKTQASLRRLKVDELAVALSNEEEHFLIPHRIDPKTKAFIPELDQESAG